MTKIKKQTQISAERKKELDHFIGRAVKEGFLNEDEASSMSYKQKEAYFEKSDYIANSYRKNER